MIAMYRYLIVLLFSWCGLQAVANADTSLGGEVLDYSLTLSLVDGQIKTDLLNRSDSVMRIRKDALPSSPLIRGVHLRAFSDSKKLNPIPIALPVGSNSELIEIAPREHVVGYIDIKWLIKDHCKVLSSSPVLMFWDYSAISEDNVLPQSSGLFRINKEDASCG